MVDFIQQNWVGILFLGAMLAMHLGGRRRRHSGQGGMMHGGCGAGHSGHSTRVPTEHRDHHEPASQPRSPWDPSGPVTASPTADAGRPDPTRDAINPDEDQPVHPDPTGLGVRQPQDRWPVGQDHRPR